jgi:hypothetical protein
VSEDKAVSYRLWPASSPDLNPCDFYLWGNEKTKCIQISPHAGWTDVQHSWNNYIYQGQWTQTGANTFQRHGSLLKCRRETF